MTCWSALTKRLGCSTTLRRVDGLSTGGEGLHFTGEEKWKSFKLRKAVSFHACGKLIGSSLSDVHPNPRGAAPDGLIGPRIFKSNAGGSCNVNHCPSQARRFHSADKRGSIYPQSAKALGPVLIPSTGPVMLTNSSSGLHSMRMRSASTSAS
jgi:hypothetical protein